MEPTVRPYDDADLAACRALWTDLTQHHRDLYDSQGIGGSEPHLRFDEHLEQVGANRIWVAHEGDVIIGMVGIIEKDGEVEIEPIVVTPEHQGTGVGRTMVAAVLETAADLGVSRVTVRPAARNQRTLAFFHDLGFSTVGHVELMLDFDPTDRWRPGLDVGGRTFNV